MHTVKLRSQRYQGASGLLTVVLDLLRHFDVGLGPPFIGSSNRSLANFKSVDSTVFVLLSMRLIDS